MLERVGEAEQTLQPVHVTPLEEQYKRKLNGRSRTKNLRCFPCCSNPHNATGFCGSSLDVHFSIATLLPCEYSASSRLWAVARFVRAGEDLSKEKLPKRDNLVNIRSKDRPQDEWIEVLVEVKETEGLAKFKVNPHLLGWHYAWKSNKSTRRTAHCLQLLVFIKEDQGELRMVHRYETPSFTLFSNAKYEDKPVHVPAKRKLSKEIDIEKGEAGSGGIAVRPLTSRPRISESGTERVKPKPLDNVSALRVLEKVTSVLRQREAERDLGSVEVGDPEMLRSLDDFDEALGLIAGLFGNEDELDTTTWKADLEDRDDGWSLSEALINQVVDSILSDKLNNAVVAFFRECASGYVGQALSEALGQLDSDVSNPFMYEFAKSLLRKFEAIIAERLETDLFECGYTTVKRRAPTTLSKQQIRCSPEVEEEALRSFAEVLNVYSSFFCGSTTGIWSRFSKRWVPLPGQLNFYMDVLYGELGILDLVSAKVHAKMMESCSFHSTNNKICVKTEMILGFPGYLEFIPDGKPHEFCRIAPLFHYLTFPLGDYVCEQSVDADGNYS